MSGLWIPKDLIRCSKFKHIRGLNQKMILRLITKLPECEIYRKTIASPPVPRRLHMMPRPDVLLIQYLYKRFLVLANLNVLQKAFKIHVKLVCFYIFHAGNGNFLNLSSLTSTRFFRISDLINFTRRYNFRGNSEALWMSLQIISGKFSWILSEASTMRVMEWHYRHGRMRWNFINCRLCNLFLQSY